MNSSEMNSSEIDGDFDDINITVENVKILYNLITKKSPSYWRDITYRVEPNTNIVSIAWPKSGLSLDVSPTDFTLHNYKTFQITYSLDEESINNLVNDLVTLREI